MKGTIINEVNHVKKKKCENLATLFPIILSFHLIHLVTKDSNSVCFTSGHCFGHYPLLLTLTTAFILNGVLWVSDGSFLICLPHSHNIHFPKNTVLIISLCWSNSISNAYRHSHRQPAATPPPARNTPKKPSWNTAQLKELGSPSSAFCAAIPSEGQATTPCHNTAHQTLTNKNKTFNTKNLNQY